MNARPLPVPPYLKPRLLGIGLVAALVTIAGSLLVLRYAQLDFERDIASWQDKLNLIADTRAAAVSEWVESRFAEMKRLAENPSLALYFAQAAAPAVTGNPAAEKSYLRNLLTYTADRMGFAPESSAGFFNFSAGGNGIGIAVLNASGNIVVSTPHLSALDDAALKRLQALKPGDTAFIDFYRNAVGEPRLGFVTPIYPVQADASAAPIGRIVGIASADTAFYNLLRPPGITEKTLETMLVEPSGDHIVFLSPRLSGAPPLKEKPDANLAAAFAAAHPGAFAETRDYRGKKVLVTSRPIPQTPWTLVVKIDRAEALGPEEIRRGGMVLMLFLVLGLVVAVVIAVWYIAGSRRAILASRYFRENAERLREQGRLLRLVTDNQPENVYILDSEHRYRFANANARLSAAMQEGDMIGKYINDVQGAARGMEIIEACNDALTHHAPQTRVKRVAAGGGPERVIKAIYVPIAHLPVPDLPEPEPGVLVVEQDITEVAHEREQRIHAHKELIDTLITIVDRRDPHAANHSGLVAETAYAVAKGMGLDQTLCETARIAGSLMNIGKVVIPEEVLTKRAQLSDQERRAIRDSMMASAALLSEVTFEGPVVETLFQAQEHWDGTGPQGLKGDDILVTARIIAVVNSFVGMISPRSYRAAMSVHAATRLLVERIDTQFDRKVVFALVDQIENHGGREMLARSGAT